MLTTNNIKVRTKEMKPERLTTLTTNKVKPKEFIMKGKSRARNKTVITTSNVEKFQKKGKKK